MVSTRAKSDLPPRSPQATQSKKDRSRRGAAAAASSVSSKRSRGSSVESADSGDEVGSDDDILPHSSSFQPPPTPLARRTTGAASVSSTGSRKGALDYSTEKQLLLDIEAQGGIYFFEAGKTQGLSQLLDNPARSRLYGDRGNPIRQKISRRVRYLKQFEQVKYNKLLAGYGIQPAKLSKKQAELIGRSPRPVKLVNTEQVKKEDFSDLENDESSVQPEHIKSSSRSVKPTSVVSSSSIKPDLVASSAVKEPGLVPAIPKNTSIVSAALSRNSNMSDDDYVDIWLDPDSPFNNPEGIMLSTFTGLEYKGDMYDGLNILVQGDPRDVSADAFKLEVFDPPDRPKNVELTKPCNKFTLTMPLVPAGLWMDRKDLTDDDDTAPVCIKNGIAVSMQAVKDLSEGKNKKTFVIGIKNGAKMKLNDVPFIPTDEPSDSTVLRPFHPVTFYDTGHREPKDPDTGDREPIINMGTYVSWRLCDMGSKRKMTDEVKKGPAGATGVAAALAARRKKAKGGAGGTVPGSQNDRPLSHGKPSQVQIRSDSVPSAPAAAKTKPAPAAATNMEVDTDTIEADMMDSMLKSGLDEHPYDISEDGWQIVQPLLEQYVVAYPNQDVLELYHIARGIAIDTYTQRDNPVGTIEDYLISFVKHEVERGLRYHQQSQTKQSTLNKVVLEAGRKDLFKPVASSREERAHATEKSRQNKRKQAVNKARNTELKMETLVNESINETQKVLNEINKGSDDHQMSS